MKQKPTCLTTIRRKTNNKKKTIIDPNWLYILRESEKAEQVINR